MRELTWVHKASDDGVLDAVVIELVVGPEGRQSSGPDGVGKEDLRGGVYPALGVPQLAPVGGDVQQQAWAVESIWRTFILNQ